MYFECDVPFEMYIYLQKRGVGKLSLENKEDGKIKITFYYFASSPSNVHSSVADIVVGGMSRNISAEVTGPS